MFYITRDIAIARIVKWLWMERKKEIVNEVNSREGKKGMGFLVTHSLLNVM